jgi:hypothetical protein
MNSGITVELENILKEFILILLSRNLTKASYEIIKIFDTA